MVVVPVASALTTPLEEPMSATVLLVLLHVPAAALVSEVVRPEHTVGPPAMAGGAAETETTMLVLQPPGVVYVMLVVPAPMPATMPEVKPTVPAVVLLLIHVPLLVALPSVVTLPTQVVLMPVMAEGAGSTVTIAVAVAQPGTE